MLPQKTCRWEARALLPTRETFPSSSQQRHHTGKFKISLRNNPPPRFAFTTSFSHRFQTWKHTLSYRASPVPPMFAQRARTPSLRRILRRSCCISADRGLPPLQFPLHFFVYFSRKWSTISQLLTEKSSDHRSTQTKTWTTTASARISV